MLVDLLDRGRIVLRPDGLGLLRTLDDRRLGREFLKASDGLDQQVVLTRQLQRNLRFGDFARIIDNEAPILVFDLVRNRNVDHAEFGHLVIPEDLGVLPPEPGDPAIDLRDPLLQSVLLDEVDKKQNDRQKPHPQSADLLFELDLLFLQDRNLLLDALLFRDNLFSSLLIIVEQDLGLILITIRGFRENFSFHGY